MVEGEFSRNIGSISLEQQQMLQGATVSVIGCGGLGGFVIDGLARLGVGTLRICDLDCFSRSNLNRQLYATTASLGRYKAEVAAEQVSRIHDRTRVVPVTSRFQDVPEQLFPDTQVVVDCLDNQQGRLALADLCNQQRKSLPLVHGAVFQWHGQVGVQSGGGSLIHDLYAEQPDREEYTPSVLSCTVQVVAGLQVAETCKLLLSMESPLIDNWMIIDLERMTFEISHPITKEVHHDCSC